MRVFVRWQVPPLLPGPGKDSRPFHSDRIECLRIETERLQNCRSYLRRRHRGCNDGLFEPGIRHDERDMGVILVEAAVLGDLRPAGEITPTLAMPMMSGVRESVAGSWKGKLNSPGTR
jgi:hypothetical protein